jgi:putative tryptophan/tyrosine transport system substrate-binding protein
MSPRYEDVRVGTFMKRREFITLVGGAASLPLAVQAQQPMPVIGFLHSAFRGPAAHQEAAFLDGLKEAGFVDGRNVRIEYRWAEGHLDRLAALAADLADRRVTAIAALGGDTTALAARRATGTIPIVFVNGSDPVKSGLVASINRPAGNVTGVSLFASAVDAKRLELLHEVVPKVAVVGVLNNAFVAETETRSRALADAAKSIGVQLSFLNVDREEDFDKTFATLADRGIGALFVSGSPFFISRRDRLVSLVARQQIPAIYAWRELVEAGGLASYGANVAGSYRQAGVYMGRILKGEKPADLPVLQPTKFEFVINLKTARTLGLEIPDRLIALADEVIE